MSLTDRVLVVIAGLLALAIVAVLVLLIGGATIGPIEVVLLGLMVVALGVLVGVVRSRLARTAQRST